MILQLPPYPQPLSIVSLIISVVQFDDTAATAILKSTVMYYKQ